ncbi:PPOX class F420-dependent enzyme [Prauserella marina]|uniref:Pyridoxamine 5'-phosphate oxidase N-terminal domain-containing protein n=1 Tax=Prauserella marina TaxID=530584 RepID=A0A222VUG3_9PSEU|nr:PPOX class F420-dependent oxidoreductase [Prauserella marina]ASR37555.1 PPOX class F420-dependent enzyme [Prauserella marina]PWV75456.1 hypothetical protein DES30_10671 [Prauserella marina]SDD34144.1 hypothetical protein SAMN05421630_107369 [Prauserella marina]
MGTELERLATEKYVLLTTFRKSGDAVPTPVWAARLGDELVVWSERAAGKVKRIRAGSQVELVACDLRGKQTHGQTVRGKARILDDEGTAATREAIARKYGIVGRVTMFFSKLRGGPQRTVGLAIDITN